MGDDRLSRREVFGLLVASALVVAFVFGVGLTPFDGLDFQSIFLPYETFFRDSLRAGEFPFWNPYGSLGRPFAADPSTIAFWPLSLVYLATNVYVGAILLAWAHAAAAAWASAKFCLRLGAQRPLALLSGIAFAFSGKLLGHFQAGHVQFVYSYLYLPVLLYLAKRVQDEGSRRAVGLLACVSWLQFLAGAPQVYWNCALALGFFVVGSRCTLPFRRSLMLIWGDTWRVIAAYLLGLAASAALLVPTWELIGQSNRSAARTAFSADGSLALHSWTSLFSTRVSAPFLIDWELLLYGGVIVAVAGLAGFARWRDSGQRGILAVFLGSGLVATAGSTPLGSYFVRFLPEYGAFHIHARTGAVLVYALVVSAGLLLSDPNRRRSAILILGVGLCALMLLICTPPFLWSGAEAAAWSLRGLVLVALSSGLLGAWLYCSEGAPRRILAWACLALFLADMVGTGWQLKQAYVTKQNYFGEAPLVEMLLQAGYLSANQPPPRVFTPRDIARANGGMLYGYATPAGSEDLALSRVWKFVHWSVGIDAPTMSDLYAWSVIEGKGAFPIPNVGLVAGISRKTNAVELNRSRPERAWLNTRVRQVPNWEDGDIRMATGQDPKQIAFIESPLASDESLDASLSAGQARITGFSRNRVIVRTQAPGRSLLVLDEAWFPGWKATVNGVDAAVRPVNGWMRAVVVPAGNSEVIFSYSPNHFGVGIAISVLALCGMASLLWSRRAGQSVTGSAS